MCFFARRSRARERAHVFKVLRVRDGFKINFRNNRLHDGAIVNSILGVFATDIMLANNESSNLWVDFVRKNFITA